MPWTVKTAKKHNKNANATWIRIANGALRDGHSEASAIRMASAAIKKGRNKKGNPARAVMRG